MSPRQMAVLFADVSGSTSLYDTFGDTEAKRLVDECMEVMRAVVAQREGRVVKTIGDEVMCVFPDADSGRLAATELQQRVAALPEVRGTKRAIRIGLHFGPVIDEGGDVFGDTVNTASRLTALAKGAQIITSAFTVESLSPELRHGIRRIAALAIRGKHEDIDVYEVMWRGGADVTMSFASVPRSAPRRFLELVHGSGRRVMGTRDDAISLGRDAACQIVLGSPTASRVHARIERRRDKFFLVDLSTNGTFVTFAGEGEVVLRHEEVMLRGRGRITFGQSGRETSENGVEFSVHDVDAGRQDPHAARR